MCTNARICYKAGHGLALFACLCKAYACGIVKSTALSLPAPLKNSKSSGGPFFENRTWKVKVIAMESSKPLPYTTSPLRLIWVDTILFFRITLVLPITAGLLSIVLPVFPLRSGALDELYPSAANIYAITLHTILIIAQLGFIFSLLPPALCGLPVPFYAAYLIGFVAINHAVSGLLNGRPKSYTSQIDLSGWSSHDDEKWFFINGVAVGQTWLQNNLDRFALTFRRPIYGIQNYTWVTYKDTVSCSMLICHD